jgi:hypothetical protein
MIDPRLAIRLKRAWKALTNEQRARIRPLAERAHTELGSILSTRAMPAPITPIQHRELIYFKAALEDREEVYVRSAIMASKQSAALGEVIGTDPSGNIIGFGKYQLLDRDGSKRVSSGSRIWPLVMFFRLVRSCRDVALSLTT